MLRSRRRFLQKVADRLKEGSKVVVTDVDHRNVWRMKRRLAELSGRSIEADAVTYKGMDAYEFYAKNSS